jgi:hypothetical protein
MARVDYNQYDIPALELEKCPNKGLDESFAGLFAPPDKPLKDIAFSPIEVLPSTISSEVVDSTDEIATKEAAKDFLNGLASATATPKLPVQYDNPVAAQLFQLYFQGIIDSDAKQGITSQLYQSPSNGNVIFCRDTRGYNENAAIDPCYAYARYGIGLYLSQHIIYQAYGIKDTAFIAENAQKFYEQFIADIKAYQSGLSHHLSEEKKAELVRTYALRYLSDTGHNIATELTAQLGKQNKEFETVAASLESLDMTVISASMAWKPIPYVTVEQVSYKDVKKEYLTIVHPKPGKMTDEIKELYENFDLTGNTAEKSSFSNTEKKTEQKSISDGRGSHNFFDAFKSCKKRMANYFKEAILAGKVTLCSQDRGNFAGVKNVRTIVTEEIVRDESGNIIKLKPIGSITGNSTALAAFRNVSETTLKDYTRRSLLQLPETLSTDGGRELRLCGVSLCGIDIKTTFDNRFNDKEEKIDALDAKIARITAAAADETEGKVYFSNLAINYERFAVLIKGDDIASKLAQNAIAALTGYENLSEMLDYVYHVAGIIENIAYMQEFIDQYDLSEVDRYQFEQYLKLMQSVLTEGMSGNPINSRDIFLDTAAVFSMLCAVHNEMVIKYDPDKKVDFIKPFFNCASGENRTGAAIFRYMVLSRTADIIGVDNIPKLLDEEYYPTRRTIGNNIARTGIIQYDNESCGSTQGTGGVRKKNADSFSPKDISLEVLKKYILTAYSSFKSLLFKPSSKKGEYVYTPKTEPIVIGHQRQNQPAVGHPNQSIVEKKAPPIQQSTENMGKNDLKKGSTIGIIAFVTLAFVAAFVEQLHIGLYILGTLAGAGAVTLGWKHSREDEKAANPKLERNRSSGFFGFFKPKSEIPAEGIELQDMTSEAETGLKK